MDKEDKELLLADLSARLPYGVKIMFSSNGFRWDWEQTLEEIIKCDDGEYAINGWGIHGIKPYLRPMSSMTEEEKKKFKKLLEEVWMGGRPYISASASFYDWLNKHHFDYRGLIPMGLALEAPEGVYKKG